MSTISLDPKIERNLIELAKENPENFGEIYRHYYPHLLKFTQSKLTQKEIAEDITSQVFHKALQNIHTFTWQDISFSAWLYQIAKRLIIDHYRKVSRQKTNVIGEQSDETLPRNPANLQNDTHLEIQSDMVQKALLTFENREREIVYKKFYLGYSNKLIADELGLSQTNVSSIIHRVVKKLQKSLS